jgi:hypothetical protein
MRPGIGFPLAENGLALRDERYGWRARDIGRHQADVVACRDDCGELRRLLVRDGNADDKRSAVAILSPGDFRGGRRVGVRAKFNSTRLTAGCMLP